MARICMIAFTQYSTDTRVRREAEALVDRGDTVEVICLKRKGEEFRDLNGVNLIQLPTGRYRGANTAMYLVKYSLFFVAVFFMLAFLQWKNKYQIIQVHTMPDFMVFAALIPKLLGVKIILDVHDLVPELYRSKFGLAKDHWVIRFITWIERCSIGFADRAIAVHKPHLDTLMSHGNPMEKFVVLLNLPDPKLFSRKNLAGVENNCSLRLIYHGTVSRRHGLDIVLLAISQLRKEIKDLHFKVVGQGDDVQRLTALTKELQIADCVSFVESVLPENLASIILNADIGIVPILYDDFTRHMLPVKLLEYVALGKPVICSRTETIQSYFDDSMVEYFAPGDAVELAHHIRVLYQNPEKREYLRINADRFNQEHDWARQKQLYYQLIDGLLA